MKSNAVGKSISRAEILNISPIGIQIISYKDKMEKEKENELHLPLIESEPPQHSLRSVDEINEWIEHDYQLFFDRKIYEREKRKNSVNVPFVL